MVRCKRCNRELTNPHSIKIGAGPTCQRRIEAERQMEFDFNDPRAGSAGVEHQPPE
jgi:hypothetical protein